MLTQAGPASTDTRSLASILRLAREMVERHEAEVLPLAALTVFDALITAVLGHTNPTVRMLCGDIAPGNGETGASLLSLPARTVEARDAACSNALALCWYELDPGFRHAGCHATLHILPTLLALAQQRGRDVQWLLRQFAYCYEIVARLALGWDTPRSGLHSHPVFAPMGATLAQCVAHERDMDFTVRALNLAATTVHFGFASEVRQGGEVRNLWPALAATNSFALHAAASAHVGTSAHRLVEIFDRTFGRRDGSLASRFDGPAITQDYKKVFPCCRHLHSAVAAALSVVDGLKGVCQVETIRGVQVVAHAEAAALSNTRPDNLLTAQFSLPVCVAIALATGRFDPQTLLAHRDDDRILDFAARIEIAEPHGDRYPNDRGARVTVELADGHKLTATADHAPGEPGEDQEALVLGRKVELVMDSIASEDRQRFQDGQARLYETLHRPDSSVRDALAVFA